MSAIEAPPARVVNVKVAYIRPAYADLKAWCADPNNVYIGRAGIVFVTSETGGRIRYPPVASRWCNPFKAKDHGLAKCLALYEDYIRQVPFLEEIEELRGKNLGCWCVVPETGTKQSGGCLDDKVIKDEQSGEAPPICHGQILVKILRERQTSSQ